MRPVDFHTSVSRLADAERLLQRGERPAVQQTFAAEVKKNIAEQEQTVQRNEAAHAVRFEPRQQQQQRRQQEKGKEEQDERDKTKRRRRLDLRV